MARKKGATPDASQENSAIDQLMPNGVAHQVGGCLEVHFPHEAEFVRTDRLDAQK